MERGLMVKILKNLNLKVQRQNWYRAKIKAYRAVEVIIEDELEIDNDLFRFYYRVIQALTENRPDIIDDDFLQKLVDVRLAMDLLMERKPEWFYRSHTRDGKA